jgi:hypothetical protein
LRRLLSIAAMSLLLGGCTLLDPPTAPGPLVMAPPEGFAPADAEDVVFDAVSDNFKRGGFLIDRVDRTYRQVITAPLIAGSFPEFWRRESPGFSDAIEAAFHRLRRTAVADVRPLPDGRFEVVVRVLTERFANPQQRIPSPGEQIGGGQFLRQSPLEDRGVNLNSIDVVDPSGGFWVDLGRDHELERRLLARLAVLYVERTGAAAGPGTTTPPEQPAPKPDPEKAGPARPAPAKPAAPEMPAPRPDAEKAR